MAGRPPSRASVIPVANIMEVDAIVDESWRLVTLAPEISTKIQTLEWLVRRRLIKNEVLCATCQQPARLTAYVQGTDGYRWKCYRHNFTQSVRQEEASTTTWNNGTTVPVVPGGVSVAKPGEKQPIWRDHGCHHPDLPPELTLNR